MKIHLMRLCGGFGIAWGSRVSAAARCSWSLCAESGN